MRKTLPGLILLTLLPITRLAAQNTEAALNKLAAKHATEKLYIHYDKEYYVAGETIFFKAYLYNDGKPSGMSNNLYLQFADSKGSIVSTKKFPVLGAIAKGSIDVPDSLPQGNYFIRALTPVMLNDDESFVYKKNIFVYKPGSSNKAPATAPTVSLQFFPESGDLVDGILTVIGFKATDQWGKPVEVSGSIKTEDGTFIAPFNSYHDGIGKIRPFKAQAGKKYVAEVETGAGKRSYPLPEVKLSGINLKVEDEKGGKKFTLSRSVKNKQDFASVKLVAQINNHSVYENEIAFEDYPSIIGHLVTDSLPSGILHLTLFNKDGAPLAERLCFVNNREYASNATITATKFADTRRAENTIELNFPESIQTSCSVAITDASGGSFKDNENIWSRLLLTSDLKGYVYNPSWYFENTSDSTKQALDNLMLTHGWSRFSWTRILADQFPEHTVFDQPLISLAGTTMDDKNKEVQGNGRLNIYMESEDSSSQNYEANVDANGRFKLDSILFYGKAKLYYAFTDNKAKVKPALLVLDENKLNQFAGKVSHAMFVNTVSYDPFMNKSEIDTRAGHIKSRLEEFKELERVTVQAKTNKKPIDAVNEKYTSGVFRTPGKVNLDNVNDPSNDKAMNAVDYIKNRIPQVEIQSNQFVNRKNFSLMTGKKWLIGVFLNEIPADIFQLRILRTDDIALVKFYEAGFVGVGSGYPGGAIAVYTKEKDKNEEKPEKLAFVEYKGYSISKEFYQPDYNNAELKHPVSDNRTTLYWNPDVYTDSETKSVKLNFFNNDFSKKFKVVVEGFDANGKLVHVEKLIGN